MDQVFREQMETLGISSFPSDPQAWLPLSQGMSVPCASAVVCVCPWAPSPLSHQSGFSGGLLFKTIFNRELFDLISVFSVQTLVTQSHSTLGDPVDCSPPGSSVHGILQARILWWVAISLSREFQCTVVNRNRNSREK